MKLLLTALLLLTSVVTQEPAKAQLDGNDSHYQLMEALEARGINTYINAPPCYTTNAAGMYGHNRRIGPMLIVCQDNKTQRRFVEVEWTPNDLDTLRHEATHAIQDCLDGKQDGELASLYGPESLGAIGMDLEFVVDQLGYERATSIVRLYQANGADDKTIANELEAFYTAEHATAEEIEVLLNSSCPLK